MLEKKPNERGLYLKAICEPKLHDNLAKDVLALAQAA